MRRLASSSAVEGLEGLEGGGMLWEGARRGGMLGFKDAIDSSSRRQDILMEAQMQVPVVDLEEAT